MAQFENDTYDVQEKICSILKCILHIHSQQTHAHINRIKHNNSFSNRAYFSVLVSCFMYGSILILILNRNEICVNIQRNQQAREHDRAFSVSNCFCFKVIVT